MARSGQELLRKASGARYLGRRPSGPGQGFEFDYHLAPAATGPPEHSHDQESEHFEVLSGRVRVWVEGNPLLLAAGDSLDIPPATRHRLANEEATEARIRISFSGGRFEEMLDGLFACQGRPRGIREALGLAAHTRRHIGAARPASPWTRLLIHGFGLVGGLLGHRSL